VKTYLINLDRNPERLAFMRGQLERLGIPFERFPAVYGKELAPEARARGFSRVRSFIASKKRLSDAEIGVAMSHVGCYRRMVEAEEPYALVLEDDVSLGAGFAATLSRVEAFLSPGRPQLVLLSGYGVEGAESMPEEIRAEKSAWCADAYVVTLSAAKLVLKANDPVITVADSFKRWRRRFGLELYRALPATARQEDETFKSENQVLPKSGWLVRNLMWVLDWILVKATGR
jgi:glycosyl transferase family 25